MEAGLLQFLGSLRRSVLLEQIYERALQRIEIMDKTGYDAVWLVEHHFTG